jgi:AsmA protein
MNKYLKYGLWLVGGIITLIIGVLAFIALTFDPNDYKPQIVQLVKDKTGRTLAIEGDIGLKLFPKIGAEVGKVTLSERGGNAEFAVAWTRRRCISRSAAASREVVVDAVRVDGLRANLVKYKDGSTNFADLTGGGEKPAPAPAQEPAQPAKPIRLEVSGVTISNSRLTWKDETNGNDLAIELSSSRLGASPRRHPAKWC